MSKYRRIEIMAFRRRVTIVSGGELRKKSGAQPDQIDDSVSLTDTDSDETVALDSPEGQLILVEAVRSLEHRLSPAARAKICADQNPLASRPSKRNRFYLRLQSLHDQVHQKLHALLDRTKKGRHENAPLKHSKEAQSTLR